MNRLIDDPGEVAEGLVRGAVRARPDLHAATDHPRVVGRAGEGGVRIHGDEPGDTGKTKMAVERAAAGASANRRGDPLPVIRPAP